jgi:O-antigen ligase
MSVREFGLYHDPGTLSNIALYNIIFTSFMYHLMPRKNPAWLIYSSVTVIISLYLIYIGLSRAVFIQMIVFGLIYVGIFRRGLGKFVTVFFVGLVIALGAILGLDYGRYTQRFQSEIIVLTDSEQVSRTKQDKDVDLGAMERLGSNRGQLVAYALDDILKRPAWQVMVGNFTESPSHSDYIDVLSRNGVIGLLIYLLLLFFIWLKTFSLLTSGRGKPGWAMDVLAFALINLYILYSIPFRPLSYTTLSWFMWAVIGYAFGRRYWINHAAHDQKAVKEKKNRFPGHKQTRPQAVRVIAK